MKDENNDDAAESKINIGMELDSNLETITSRAATALNTTVEGNAMQQPGNAFDLTSVKAGMTSVLNIMLPSQRIK